jgi:hypothetical protein
MATLLPGMMVNVRIRQVRPTAVLVLFVCVCVDKDLLILSVYRVRGDGGGETVIAADTARSMHMGFSTVCCWLCKA